MTKKTRRMGLYLPLLIIFSITTVTLRTIALIKHYEPTGGYFDDNTLINVSAWILVGLSVLFFTYIFYSEHDEVKFDFSTSGSFIPSSLVALGMLFLGTFMLLRDNIRHGSILNQAQASETVILFERILFILALLGAVYFALASIIPDRYSALRGGFGLCTALFFIAYAAYLYFDQTLVMNAPNKLTDITTYLFVALFFLVETRISLGRQTYRLYGVVGLISAALCAYSSVPSLIYYFSDEVIAANSLYDSYLALALLFFILSRLFKLSRSINDTDSDFVAILADEAYITEARLNEKEEAEKLEYIALINSIAKKNEVKEETEAAPIDDFREEADAIPSPEAEAVSEIVSLTEDEGEIFAIPTSGLADISDPKIQTEEES